jgi:hypothetical protein
MITPNLGILYGAEYVGPDVVVEMSTISFPGARPGIASTTT